MHNRKIVSREDWLQARQTLLSQEKELTRLQDQLSQQRRALPWVAVSQDYRFQGPSGDVSLRDLFGDCSQLLVYHFMFGPDWQQGCPSCSFWADNYNGIDRHLQQRDIQLVTVSRAPLQTLLDYRDRMGWDFQWYSSLGSDFNSDFHVSFVDQPTDIEYNYRTQPYFSDEMPGISAFYKDADGTVYHTYSCYARGVEIVNGAYHYMDLAPKGRDEDSLEFSMAWVRRRDEYA